ncbi:MAG: 4-(cytidine 5'-diphospho)-2-C-methyl-D-erythritol kinase [Acidimicrobiales bacterium]
MPPSDRVIRLLAPAKLTTSLRVLGKRDDGYHLLDAEMTSLDLADELELVELGSSTGEEPGRAALVVLDRVAWNGLRGAGPADGAELSFLPPGSNLVERALELSGRRARCTLTKHIPAGSGLGGGSSDAAAILRWAGINDPATAARLGADVPFCLVGGTARVGGIGEVVEPVEQAVGPGGAASAFLLVTPKLHVSTAVVYAAFDDLDSTAAEKDNGNDLELAALRAYPELRWWRDLLGAASGERPRLAGSGGTWFVEGPPRRLGQLAEQVRAEIVASREGALVAVAQRNDHVTKAFGPTDAVAEKSGPTSRLPRDSSRPG